MADFKLLPQDLRNPNPQGRNGLSAFADYYQRLLYREVYPVNIWAPLDTWYDKQYYGKVDRFQNTVLPRSSTIKAMKHTKTPNLLALSFLADAFDSLATHMHHAKMMGVLNPEGTATLLEMKAHRAYENPMQTYGQFLNTVFESFNNKMHPFTDQITDFSTFYPLFMEHLLLVASYLPVTLTNYLLTDTISPFNSALTIAIDTAQFDNDEYKYDTFIEDPNYTFYVRAAKKFGFIVNKNAPWLLSADLFSEALVKSLPEGIDEDLFFPAYYDFTYEKDIPILKQFIINSYSSFIERNPWSEKRIFKPGCDGFKVDRTYRTPLASNTTNMALITDKQLAHLYLQLRSIEADSPVPLTKKLHTELNSIYEGRPNPNQSSLENVAAYINLIYRDYIYSTSYPALNLNVYKNLDNQMRRGKIATAGSIVQQLY